MTLDYLIWVLSGVSAGTLVYGGWHALDRWFAAYEDKYVEKAGEDLYSMFSNIPPKRVLQWSMGCFATAFLVCLILLGRFGSTTQTFISIFGSAVPGFFASLLPRMILKQMRVLRLRKFDLQLLDALLSMSNALKAGFSIIQSLESIVQEGRNPIAQEFDLFLREVRLGAKFEEASENLYKRMPSEDLQIVLTGIETARQTGGNLTEVFDRLAVVIRERMRVQGHIRSLTAQGRMQGWVVGLMPMVLGGAIYFIQPAMMIGFLRSPAGILAILGIFCLQVMGFYVIRKIVNIDV